MSKPSGAIDMTQGKPINLMLRFALPMMIGSIFQSLYSMVDSAVLGRFVGSHALAAIGATTSTTGLILLLATGVTSAISIVLSQYVGANNTDRVRKGIVASGWITLLLGVVLGLISVFAARPLMQLLKTPEDVIDMSVLYIQIVCGCGIAQFAYNAAASILRALGDSKTPLYFLVFSSVLNIILDIVFIVPMHMGVAGAAWATILSQFLSAVFSTVVGLRNFPILHLRREDFHDLKGAAVLHLKTGFPMGFQMSVMCIGQLAMQAVVNSLGTAAVAGYTAASKADQLSVLVNNAMMTAISNYVAQNFGAGKKDRIRLGVRASLIQTEAFNILMCIGILLLRHPIVELFLSNPTAEIYHYSDAFLTIEAPFYFLLGLLAVYRTSIQSMQNGRAPFAACMIELVMRLAATVWLSRFLGYTAVCIASPLAWFGAIALLIPVYYRMMMKPVKTV